MMDDVVNRMVKEFPAETLRLIFSDDSGRFHIEKAVNKLNTPPQFIAKWVNDNRLPAGVFNLVKTLYHDHLNQTVEKLRKEANEKVRIRVV